MSGTDLAGITSVARVSVARQGVPSVESSVDANGTTGVDLDRQPTRRKPRRTGAGLPSNVIHELRTPLTSIHGYAQVLQRSLRENPRQSNAIGVVVRESTRLSAMLGALSELAELQSGDLVCAAVPVDVEQIVEGVVLEISRQDAGKHPIHFEGKGVARCTPTLLSQAILHVVTNAARYSPEGSPISICITQRADAVEIAIADHGMGIESEDAERVYEPFERGCNAKQTGVRGLGLGLYLARESLLTMQGWIEHRAREHGGTIFRLSVPAT